MSETTPLNEWPEADLCKLHAFVEYGCEKPGTESDKEFADRVLPVIKQALKDVLFETYHGK